MKVKPVGCAAESISLRVVLRSLLSGKLSWGAGVDLQVIDLHSMSNWIQAPYEVSWEFAYVVDKPNMHPRVSGNTQLHRTFSQYYIFIVTPFMIAKYENNTIYILNGGPAALLQ